MNSSTRACVTILNVFGLISLLIGVIATTLIVVSSGEFSLILLLEAIPGLASILSGALLVGASEALRLLSEIRDGLAPATTTAQRVTKAA